MTAISDSTIRQRLRNDDGSPRGPGAGKLYTQVANLIRRRIREAIWRPGDRLPSLERLTREFGVSLITVRRAVELLENEGVLRRIQGRGTFVARTANAREWLRLETTWEDILKTYEIGKSNLRNKLIAQKKGCRLPPDEGEEAQGSGSSFRYLRRLHMVDNVPYAFTDLFLDEDVYKLAPDDFSKQMVLKVLATHSDIETGTAYQRVMLGAADEEAAELLEVSVGSPVGELLRTVHDPSGRIIYRGNVTYRGDLVRIETRLK